MKKKGNRVEEDRRNYNCITSYVYVFILYTLYINICVCSIILYSIYMLVYVTYKNRVTVFRARIELNRIN